MLTVMDVPLGVEAINKNDGYTTVTASSVCEMMGTVASPLSISNESMPGSLALLISLIVALFIIFFAFLTVRISTALCPGHGRSFGLCLIMRSWLFYRSTSCTKQQQGRRGRHGRRTSEPTTPEQRSTAKRQQNVLRKIGYSIFWLLVVLFQVFVVLRLDGYVAWSIAVVFIPYFVLEGFSLLLSLITFVVASAMVRKSEPKEAPLLLAKAGFHLFWLQCVRLATFILIALRIDETIQCSWAVVFIPLYLVGVKYAAQLLLSYLAYRRLSQPEVAQQGKMVVTLGTIVFAVVGTLCYALIGLLARRLDGLSYISMSNVFVPVFIVLVKWKGYYWNCKQLICLISQFYSAARAAVYHACCSLHRLTRAI